MFHLKSICYTIILEKNVFVFYFFIYFWGFLFSLRNLYSSSISIHETIKIHQTFKSSFPFQTVPIIIASKTSGHEFNLDHLIPRTPTGLKQHIIKKWDLSGHLKSLPTQNIYVEKLAGRDWKKEELGESSNYYIISKTVAHPLIYSILFPQQSKIRLFIPFEMATILLFHSVDFP
jgi:hypothetical protein